MGSGGGLGVADQGLAGGAADSVDRGRVLEWQGRALQLGRRRGSSAAPRDLGRQPTVAPVGWPSLRLQTTGRRRLGWRGEKGGGALKWLWDGEGRLLL